MERSGRHALFGILLLGLEADWPADLAEGVDLLLDRMRLGAYELAYRLSDDGPLRPPKQGSDGI
jgi:hypothetical protein